MYNHQADLIKVTVTQNEIGMDIESEDYIPVMCRMANVGQEESYNAKVHGFELSVKFIIHSFEYSGEKYLRYTEDTELEYLKGKYEIKRVVFGGMQNAKYLAFDEVELTCEKVI